MKKYISSIITPKCDLGQLYSTFPLVNSGNGSGKTAIRQIKNNTQFVINAASLKSDFFLQIPYANKFSKAITK